MVTAGRRFPTLSDANLEEVAARLWINVLPHSFEYTPLALIASLSDMEGLPPGQIEELAAVQWLLSDEVRALVRASRTILTRLSQTTELEASEGRVPLGFVDWPQTLVERLTGTKNASTYSLRKSHVHRDLPENRLLRFLLSEVVRLSRSALDDPDKGWQRAVVHLRSEADAYANHPLLRDVPAEYSRQGYLAAMSSRVLGYRQVGRSSTLYDGLFRKGDRETLIELLRQRVLVPEFEDRVFELLVLFRLLQYLEEQGAKRLGVRLLGRGRGPIFSLGLGDCRFEVYFQGVPDEFAERSLYRCFARSTGLGSSLRRPDIVVRSVRQGLSIRTTLLEVKCSSDADTLRDGLFQLLGYLGDFQLHSDENLTLVLVGYQRLSDHAGAPSVGVCTVFDGYAADLDSLQQSFAAMNFC